MRKKVDKSNVLIIGYLELLFSLFPALSCDRTVQVGESTFIYKSKVFRIIDNEIMELGDLENDLINKSDLTLPKLKSYKQYNLDYVKHGAFTELSAVYRGNDLYFKMELKGFNELTEKYFRGGFTLSFADEYGFQIHSTYIPIEGLIRIVDKDKNTLRFNFNGKTSISYEIYRAIDHYTVSSSIVKKK